MAELNAHLRTAAESMESFAPYFNPSESPNYKFVIPKAPSPYLRALLTYVDALHAWDLRSILACFDEALEHRILPSSIGRPVLNKRQYGEYFKGVMPLFKTFKVTIHEVVEVDNRMTVHASSCGESTTGIPYFSEYTLIIHFVPLRPFQDPNTLPKMRFVKEFVDSAESIKFFTEATARAKEREADTQREQIGRRKSSKNGKKI